MQAASGGSAAGGAIAGLVFVAIAIGLYFIPLIVALVRKVPNRGSVAVVNFFLGWTLIGWVVALAMAARSGEQVPVKVQTVGHPGGGWHPDPTGRHQTRYFDGVSWTAHVSDNGVAGVDPPPPLPA